MFKSLPRTRTRLAQSFLARRPPPSRKLTTTARPTGTFTERLPNRPLPDPETGRKTLFSIPIFLTVLSLSALAIFNYQKSSSSVVSSTLYALRVNPVARELLGDEITFASRAPWIRGRLSQLNGDIDISYGVKGTRGEGVVRFRSVRKGRLGLFETLDWSLVMRDGGRVLLLDSATADPFPQNLSAVA